MRSVPDLKIQTLDMFVDLSWQIISEMTSLSTIATVYTVDRVQRELHQTTVERIISRIDDD